MILRIWLITTVAAAGLTGFLLGTPGRLAVVLPILGPVGLPYRIAFLAATLGVLTTGILDMETVVWRRRWETAVLAMLLAGGFFLSRSAWPSDLPLVIPVGGFVIALALLLLTQLPSGHNWQGERTALVRQIVVYLVALLLFTGIFQLHVRAMITSVTVGLVGAVLAALMWPEGVTSSYTPALMTGAVLVPVAWGLLMWPVTALLAGAVGLIAFYTASGVLRPWSGAPDRTLEEYALAGLVALTVIVVVLLRAR